MPHRPFPPIHRIAAQQLRRRLTRFRKDESGVLIVFGLFLFVAMFVAGGMAVDFMRAEYLRTEVQNTTDRAVLAAADLDQKLDPKAVVEDYMTKAGLRSHLTSVTVEQGLSYRTVKADANGSVRTTFLKPTGIGSLSIMTASGAEERINNVEISLVLDVSGSMGNYSRLSHMKTASKEFIDTVFAHTEEKRTSVSLIPYATQVNAGAALLSNYNVSTEHDYSNCVDFASSDFTTTQLSTTQRLQRTGHFDPWTNSAPPNMLVCPTQTSREIIPLSGSAATLKSRINSLYAQGNTSIDIGVKWGTTLLDEDSRSVIAKLAANSVIESSFDNRPAPYSDNETVKVMVVMTDGVNTDQFYLKDSYASGNSDVWYNDSERRYSIYNSNRNEYYDPREDAWLKQPYGENKKDKGSARRLSYPELWSRVSLAFNAYYHYYAQDGRASDYYDWLWSPRGAVGAREKDDRLSAICGAAKQKGIVIYTIGFEVTDDSAAVMRDCASSPSHFFRVEGVEISSAFNAIASSINKLRLIQ